MQMFIGSNSWEILNVLCMFNCFKKTPELLPLSSGHAFSDAQRENTEHRSRKDSKCETDSVTS